MGNEQSQLAGLEIESKAVEVCDFWTHHAASLPQHPARCSVLIGKVVVPGPLWTIQTPLEKNSKNLMVYRHPYIIKYVSSWQKNAKYYLAIEEVTPLAQVVNSMSILQICIGLNSILKALSFLHETAQVSHNNVCISCIYLAKDGTWKLGGMEYLMRFADISQDFLQKSRSSRYGKAIDKDEDKIVDKQKIDILAFTVLYKELLQGRKDDSFVGLDDFLGLNLQQISSLRALLEHDFFNHNFIQIYSFLIELPLKSDEEKTKFFLNLFESLQDFNEEIVAGQLGSLLLSRMVLLNKTAQSNFLPFLLSPREDKNNGIFSKTTFQKFISPILLEIFKVRDVQIRLLLLNHFSHFFQTFSKEQLQTCVLPELLLGIKDTNDHLVSVTLRTLADLVPILGASIVVGGKRAKLFNDGRPIQHAIRKAKSSNKKETILLLASQTGIENNQMIELPERQRPDGEEGDSSTEEVEASQEEDLENWDDWEGHEDLNSNIPSSSNKMVNHSTNKQIPDITQLDIKNVSVPEEEINFFEDMEPVIKQANKFCIEKKEVSKLSLQAEDKEDGWGVEEWE